VKKNIVLVFVLMLAVSIVSCAAKPDYKKLVNDFITSSTPLKDYEIRNVEDTTSPNWKVVIVYAKQDMSKVPVPFFVSSDGKSIVPNSMVFVDNKPVYSKKLEPELGKIDFKLADKDRIVYNPSGKKPVVMFTDPDCPFCKKAKEKLQNYNGEYKVIVKYFPLEQIHPGATKKAIGEVAEWLKKTRTDLKGADILNEAKKMVEEDIIEAQKAGISGVPTYVMEDGTLKQGLF
jgi:thiol:disulfide interchange protein DsbC